MLTPKEQGNLVLAGKEGSIFYNLSIIEIFQNPFSKKKLEIINENNNNKNLGGCDDALLIYDAPQRPRIDLNKRFLPRPNTTIA